MISGKEIKITKEKRGKCEGINWRRRTERDTREKMGKGKITRLKKEKEVKERS